MWSSWFMVALVLQLTTFGVRGQSLDEIIQMTHDSCVAESGVNEALITKVNTDGGLDDDPKLKCFMKCMMLNLGMMSPDGVVQEDAMINGIPDSPVKERFVSVVKACKTQPGADLCDVAYQTNKCYYDKDPEIYHML